MVTVVQSLLLKYQPNYYSNRNSQSKGVSNQLIFSQCSKTADNEGDGKYKEQRRRRNLDHTNCKDCGEEVHCDGNNDCPTQARLKEDAEAFRKMKHKKSSNKPPGGGDHKAPVNINDTLCSLMMGSPTEE